MWSNIMRGLFVGLVLTSATLQVFAWLQPTHKLVWATITCLSAALLVAQVQYRLRNSVLSAVVLVLMSVAVTTEVVAAVKPMYQLTVITSVCFWFALTLLQFCGESRNTETPHEPNAVE